MNKEKMESLLEIQGELNFTAEEFQDKIESVDIFFEDCDSCDRRSECSSSEKYGAGGKALCQIHDFFEENGVKSRLHPLTSEHNSDLDDILHEKGCPMPMGTRIIQGTPVVVPERNFLMVKLEDGKRFVYMLDEKDLLDRESSNEQLSKIYA